MASISGQERKALREALKGAFQSFSAMRRMGMDQLDFDLHDRTGGPIGLIDAADELITEMDESHGRPGMVRLIEAARAERPENPALRKVEQLILGTADPLGDVHPTQVVDEEVKTREGLQRVIVESAGFPVFDDVYAKLGLAEFPVCVVAYRLPSGQPVYGTGFLVANNLVMTNDHVISCARTHALPGSSIELTFGYRSQESHTAHHKLVDADWLVTYDKTLDYAIVRVQGGPGSDLLVANGTTQRGFLKLVSETPAPNSPLLILQHPYDKLDASPSTLRLTIGFAHPWVERQAQQVLRHSANTSEGSSGSPVFNGRMEVIALHNWGGPKHNEAILARHIKEHLDVTGHKELLG